MFAGLPRSESDERFPFRFEDSFLSSSGFVLHTILSFTGCELVKWLKAVTLCGAFEILLKN